MALTPGKASLLKLQAEDAVADVGKLTTLRDQLFADREQLRALRDQLRNQRDQLQARRDEFIRRLTAVLDDTVLTPEDKLTQIRMLKDAIG